VTRGDVQAWIEQRVRADAPMQAAAARRAPPSNPDDAGDVDVVDVVDVLTRDHNYMKTLVKQLSSPPGSANGATPGERRVAAVESLAAALAPHEAAEEAVLWPAVRDVLPDGGARAGEAVEQEQHAAGLLRVLVDTDPGAERFDDITTQLDGALRRHVAFEEHVLLELRSALDASRRRELGELFVAVRRNTRHPSPTGKG
jgi:hypothetical protein